MLLLPIQGQYEQTVNAQYAEKLGIGLYRERLDANVLGKYLAGLNEPIVDRPDILWPDNTAFFSILEDTLAKVCPKFAGPSASPTVEANHLAAS
jgi:hypothetical protein